MITPAGLLLGLGAGLGYALYSIFSRIILNRGYSVSGMKGMETSRAAQLTTIEPVTAAILGSVLFHQPLSVWEIAGIAMVVGSVIMMNAGTKAVSN